MEIVSLMMVAVIGIGIGPAGAALTTIAEHAGANNPESGDTTVWALTGSSGAPYTLAVPDDALYGHTSAWRTGDDGSVVQVTYANILTGGQVTQLANGFAFSTRMRMYDDYPKSATGGVKILFRDGTTRWQIQWGATSSGDPNISFTTNSDPAEITLTGYGKGYHLYEIKDLDHNGVADVYVDGNLVKSDWIGMSDTGDARVAWGDINGSAGNDQYAFWNLVSLQAVPEPVTVVLLMLGGLMLRGKKL